MKKQSFDLEAFKRQAASRIKNGETVLGKNLTHFMEHTQNDLKRNSKIEI